MKVSTSSKFIITEHPNPKVGVQCCLPYCDIELWQKVVSNTIGETPVEYAFQTEGGGFLLNGNHRADAMAAHKI